MPSATWHSVNVFVANMTGNVVFLAFALAGAPGFSIAASLIALFAFIAGAAIGGRLTRVLGADRRRPLARSSMVEATLFAAAALATVATGAASEVGRDVLIVLLAVAMGMQNAAARRLAVPDLTTTVLTLTITGMAADGRLGAGGDARLGRRTLAVIAMFGGALIGAVLVFNGSAALNLVLAFSVAGAIAVGLSGQILSDWIERRLGLRRRGFVVFGGEQVAHRQAPIRSPAFR